MLPHILRQREIWEVILYKSTLADLSKRREGCNIYGRATCNIDLDDGTEKVSACAEVHVECGVLAAVVSHALQQGSSVHVYSDSVR